MYSGEAVEQVVRMSLEGVEVAAKISGEGAKDLALILAAVLKEEHKTKGKARLSNMIRSGKDLKVFTIHEKDLKTFSQEAKRYGVMYCVLKDKNNNGKGRDVDVIARAEDAAKIQRIVERFGLTTVDKATVTETVRDIESRHNDNREPAGQPNPNIAKTERGPLSERNSRSTGREGEGAAKQPDRTSVREKLQTYRERIARDRQKDRQTERSKTKAKGSRSGKER